MRSALIALAAGPAMLGAAPPGAPRSVGVSGPADQRVHREARTESWDLVAAEPGSRRAVSIRLQRSDGWPTATVVIRRRSGVPLRVEPDQVFRGGGARGARFDGPSGSTTVSWGSGRVALRIADREVRGHLVLTGRPGPAAWGWDLGDAVRYPALARERVTMNFGVPVARGRLTGELTIAGRHVAIRGWRGAWDHVWGSFARGDEQWGFWDAYTVHGPRATWIAFGLNRRNLAVLDDARLRDRRWLGLLARVGDRGTRVCRARVRRSRWLTVGVLGDPIAHRLAARCGGLAATFTDRLPFDWLRGDPYNGIFEITQGARAGDARGFARHAAHDR